MNIRALRRTDAAIFQAHRLAALRESPEAFGSTFEEDVLLTLDLIADRLEEVTSAPRWVVFGAFEGGALVGFVGCLQEHKAKARHKTVIWGTYVNPEARGHGVGRALLTHLIAHAHQWEGVKCLTLTVVERAFAARSLYQAVGFERFGSEPDGLRQDGVSDTVIYLTLDLAARTETVESAG